MDTIRAFLSKIRTLSPFQNGQGRPPLSPPPLLVDVTEYSSTSLNITKYPWNCSGYARGPNMHDYLTCSTGFWRCLARVVNKSGFWIWHGCICKGYEEFWICLDCGSICLSNAWMCLKIPQYTCAWLNIAQCPQICVKIFE